MVDKNDVNQKAWTEHVPGQRKVVGFYDKVTIHAAYTYNKRDRSPSSAREKVTTHSMYLQDPRQVASTRDKVATHSIYLQDPRQVASTRDKVTIHSMYLQDPRQVASTRDRVTTYSMYMYQCFVKYKIYYHNSGCRCYSLSF